jgi:hypothetical protein
MSDPQTTPPANRRAKILLEPLLQIKLGLYNMILSFAFAGALLGVLRAQWVRFRTWLGYSEIKNLVDTEVARYASDALFWIVLVLLIFLVTNTLVSILATHRLIGPTVAFRRHIKALTEGDYTAQTTLREHDAFKEVAADLNALSAALAARAAEAGSAPKPEAAEPEPAEGDAPAAEPPAPPSE